MPDKGSPTFHPPCILAVQIGLPIRQLNTNFGNVAAFNQTAAVELCRSHFGDFSRPPHLLVFTVRSQDKVSTTTRIWNSPRFYMYSKNFILKRNSRALIVKDVVIKRNHRRDNITAFSTARER